MARRYTIPPQAHPRRNFGISLEALDALDTPTVEAMLRLFNLSRSGGGHPASAQELFYSLLTTGVISQHETPLVQDVSDEGLPEEASAEPITTRANQATADAIKICVVCQDDLLKENAIIKTLDCRHEYHAQCIDMWLNLRNSCPICRATAIVAP